MAPGKSNRDPGPEGGPAGPRHGGGGDPGEGGGERVALLALGSNLGDRRALLREGVRRLCAAGALRVEAASTLYACDPVDAEGGEFLNAVVRVRTALSPEALLAAARAVERALGRTGTKGDARPLDVDLLYVGDLRRSGPGLDLPHPRRLARAFVRVPLGEVCGDAVDPEDGARVADRVAAAGDAGRETLRPVEGPGWLDGADGCD